MVPSDTTVEAQKTYDEMVRRLSDEERFLRGLSLTHFSREMCLSGLKDRFPTLSTNGLRIKFFDQVYAPFLPEEECERIRLRLDRISPGS